MVAFMLLFLSSSWIWNGLSLAAMNHIDPLLSPMPLLVKRLGANIGQETLKMPRR